MPPPALLRHPTLLTGTICALGLSACARGPGATPRSAVSAYAQALRGRDAETAQRLSVPTRDRDEADLAATFAAYPDETEDLGAALSAPVASVEVTAVATLLDGTQVTLRQRDGHWRVLMPAPFPYGQQSPRQALVSFARALRHQRWDALLNLMPEAARGDLQADALGQNLLQQRAEWDRMLSLLELSLDNPIEVVGDRATMPYSDGFAVRFVREEGLWKVESPE